MPLRRSLTERLVPLTLATLFAGSMGIAWSAPALARQTQPSTPVPVTPPGDGTPTPGIPAPATPAPGTPAPQQTPPPANGGPTTPLAPPLLAPATPPVAPIPALLPAVVIRSVTIEGTVVLPAAIVVKAASAKAVGNVASKETLLQATRAVAEVYRAHGYPVAAVVGVDVTPDGALHLTVAEGTIRRIVVRGNRKTRGSTILEAITLRPGDVYHENDVQADRNRLARLGIFEEVVMSAQVPGTEETEKPLTSTGTRGSDGSLQPDHSDGSTPTDAGAAHDAVADDPAKPPADAPKTTLPATPPAAPIPVLDALPAADDDVGQVDLVVRVKERSTVNIAATIGYADSIGPVGFVDLSEINLAGTAQRVGVQWQRVTNSFINPDGSVSKGDSRQALDLNYEKPALGIHSVAYSFDYYDKNTVFLPYFTGADDTIRTYEKRHGATATVGRAVGRNVTGYLIAKREDVGYDPLDGYYSGPLPPQYLLDTAQAKVGSLGFELVADGRDAASNPHAGYLNSFTFENADNILGGNRAYRQYTVDLRSYSPINRAKNGPTLAIRLLGGYSTGEVPLPEYFFIGGYDLLRGYDLYSIYGDEMFVGTTELRTTLSPDVQGVVFIDSGNAWIPGDRPALTSLKEGIGAGLRFQSPIGPIRFDAAYGSSLKTYVTLGQSF